VAISEAIGAELIDTGTLTGPARAGMFLQRCLNALNQRGAHYPDVVVDGDCGPRTREALRGFIARRGKDWLPGPLHSRPSMPLPAHRPPRKPCPPPAASSRRPPCPGRPVAPAVHARSAAPACPRAAPGTRPGG